MWVWVWVIFEAITRQMWFVGHGLEIEGALTKSPSYDRGYSYI